MIDREHEHCKECCVEHNVTKLEIKVLQGRLADLEDRMGKMSDDIYEDTKCSISDFDCKLKELKDNYNLTIDKLKADIQSLFTEYRNLRESVMDIKNTVERSTDRMALKVESLEKKLTELLQDKKDQRNTLTNPLLVSVLGVILTGLIGGFGFLLAMFFK